LGQNVAEESDFNNFVAGWHKHKAAVTGSRTGRGWELAELAEVPEDEI